MSSRNTPTSVGKTGTRNVLDDHALETPPRAWGRPLKTPYRRTEIGNTPTSVGKTPMAHPDLQRRRKHPHERGEDITNLVEKPREWETPPRAWGRPGSLSSFVTKPGNTPTSVGKTDSCATSCRPHEKHPHERGEDLRRNEAAIAAVETPPRAWGRRMVSGEDDLAFGNTPTSVGKTPRKASSMLP